MSSEMMHSQRYLNFLETPLYEKLKKLQQEILLKDPYSSPVFNFRAEFRHFVCVFIELTQPIERACACLLLTDPCQHTCDNGCGKARSLVRVPLASRRRQE